MDGRCPTLLYSQSLLIGGHFWQLLGKIISLAFFNDTATTEIYTGEDTLSLHDALPICNTVQVSIHLHDQSFSRYKEEQFPQMVCIPDQYSTRALRGLSPNIKIDVIFFINIIFYINSVFYSITTSCLILLTGDKITLTRDLIFLSSCQKWPPIKRLWK